MAKPTGWHRVSGEGRQEKKYRQQPYDYDFKPNVVNYYTTVGIKATIARLFSGIDDDPRGLKCKLVSKRKQQHAHIEQRARTTVTSGHQRSRDRGLVTTPPQICRDFNHEVGKRLPSRRRPMSSAMLKICALEEAKRLKILFGVFSAT